MSTVLNLQQHQPLRKISSSEMASTSSMSLNPKPCLKRSSSLSANESISSSFESLASRKSVSFADSIGEDLCHVRTFNQELAELESMHKDPWWLMDRPWYYDDEEDGFDNDDEDILFSNYYYAYDDYCHYNIELKDIKEESETSSMEDEDSSKASSSSKSSTESNKNTSIIPTFISPVDLPEFEDNLRERLICIEDLRVSCSQGLLLSGSLRVSPFFLEEDFITSSIELNIRYSLDGWSTSNDLTTFTRLPTSEEKSSVLNMDEQPVDGIQHRFEILEPNHDLRCGDDLELFVQFRIGDNVIVDNNSGLKYRFICKTKSKFQPGKSLW